MPETKLNIYTFTSAWRGLAPHCSPITIFIDINLFSCIFHSCHTLLFKSYMIIKKYFTFMMDRVKYHRYTSFSGRGQLQNIYQKSK